MKWGFRLGDLDLSDGEPFLLGVFLNPATEERLAAAVIASHGLEHRPALGHVASSLAITGSKGRNPTAKKSSHVAERFPCAARQ